MISILMAAYNGEKYISEQIESILAQTYQNFRLYINDDCSTDRTYAIIKEYEEKYPEKIIISQNEFNTGSAKDNFLGMILKYRDDYLMLSDQDDIWLTDKIEKSYNKIKEMESCFGESVPILVHSDLKVVDENLNVISPSYAKTASNDYALNKLNNLITMNSVTGSTIIYNRALANLMTVNPEYMVMHDWWLALAACTFGEIGTIYESTVLYRQHGQNELGAKKVLSFRYIRYVLTHIDKMAEKLNNSYKQARCFLDVFYDKLSDKQREFLYTYAYIPKLSKFMKIVTTIKLKVKMHGFSRRVARIIVTVLE